MTSTSGCRWLASQAIGVAMRVSPREREEWAQAMSREVDEIPSDREALRWALGCLQTSCYERLKSMKLTSRLRIVSCVGAWRCGLHCWQSENVCIWECHP